MANIPTTIVLPTNIPTQDPAIAGFLSQLVLSLNQWILTVATALNNGSVSGGSIRVDATGLTVTFDPGQTDEETYFIKETPP